MKICKNCGIEKELDEFHIQTKSKDGHRNVCKKCRKNETKIYYTRHKKAYNIMSAKWNRDNKTRRREICKRHKQKPYIRFKEAIRHRIYMFMKSKSVKKNNKTFNIVGLDPEKLRFYIEKQFVDNMSWENYGKWHVDHKIPLSSARNKEEINKLCYYTNLQPMWLLDNLKKGKKYKLN